jgi:hypothetical protein
MRMISKHYQTRSVYGTIFSDYLSEEEHGLEAKRAFDVSAQLPHTRVVTRSFSLRSVNEKHRPHERDLLLDQVVLLKMLERRYRKDYESSFFEQEENRF